MIYIHVYYLIFHIYLIRILIDQYALSILLHEIYIHLYMCILNIGHVNMSINIPYPAPSFCMNKDDHKGRYHKQQSQDHQGAMYLQTTWSTLTEQK